MQLSTRLFVHLHILHVAALQYLTSQLKHAKHIAKPKLSWCEREWVVDQVQYEASQPQNKRIC